MKSQVFNIYKPAGLTPLQAVNRFTEKHPEFQNEPVTYLGRLDPLAEGVLAVLVGEHTQAEREKYLNLDKTYQAEVLFGFATDTFDVLGLVTGEGNGNVKADEIKSALHKFMGKIKLPVPAYSSVPVKGKPLYQWAREGKLGEIEIPSREVEVRALRYINFQQISASDLLSTIVGKLSQVDGDFRQEEIKQKWSEVLQNHEDTNFTVAKMEIECSSGTYVRSLANELGSELGTKAVLFKLVRTRVGEFGIGDSEVM